MLFIAPVRQSLWRTGAIKNYNDYTLGKIHAATPTGKLAPRRRSSGLSAWSSCRRKKVSSFAVTPSRMSENTFLEYMTNVVLYYIFLCSISIVLGLYLSLATGKCESYQHIKENRDHVLRGGQKLLYSCKWGASK